MNYDKVVAIVGDNSSTSMAFARKVGCELVSFHSHRFNLNVKTFCGLR